MVSKSRLDRLGLVVENFKYTYTGKVTSYNFGFFREILPLLEEHDTSVIVCDNDSISAAVDIFEKTGKTPTVLNFASAKNPGGGYRHGSKGSQEEDICRRTNLYEALISEDAHPYYDNHKQCDHYGLYDDVLLHCSNVFIIRDKEGNPIDPVSINVISCSAPNAMVYRYHCDDGCCCDGNIDKTLSLTIRSRMLGVIEGAVTFSGVNNPIILGAWGCGVFKNDPLVVASQWYDLLIENKMANYFDSVIMAIPNSKSKTYRIFEDVFCMSS